MNRHFFSGSFTISPMMRGERIPAVRTQWPTSLGGVCDECERPRVSTLGFALGSCSAGLSIRAYAMALGRFGQGLKFLDMKIELKCHGMRGSSLVMEEMLCTLGLVPHS